MDALLGALATRLRQASIRVLSGEEVLASSRMPSLDLIVNAVASNEQNLAYAIALDLKLNQRTWIVSKGVPAWSVLGDTWTRGSVLYYGIKTLKDGSLNRDIEDMTDEFVNAWLATHGR